MSGHQIEDEEAFALGETMDRGQDCEDDGDLEGAAALYQSALSQGQLKRSCLVFNKNVLKKQCIIAAEASSSILSYG